MVFILYRFLLNPQYPLPLVSVATVPLSSESVDTLLRTPPLRYQFLLACHDNVFPVTSLRHGLHHLAPVRLTESCRSMGSEPKGVATLFFFEQRAVQDHGVAPLFRTCPGTKEATSKARQRQQPRPSRMAPNTGVYVACVPVSLRHACLYRCRLLQRDQHDAVCLLVSCLLVFVLHACSCLYRNLQRGSKVQGALKLVRH